MTDKQNTEQDEVEGQGIRLETSPRSPDRP